jgi:acetylornithine deacetylase/succinyl-diaminopimelate desuccinylase-like protein
LLDHGGALVNLAMMAKPAKKSPSGSGAKVDTAQLKSAVLEHTRRPEFQTFLRELLLDLCREDTTPNADVGVMREAEATCFTRLERELSQLGFPDSRIERRAVNPGIKKHPFYSLLHFTKTAKRPAGLPPEEVYKGRSNLLFVAPGSNRGEGQSVALNAHIDVVAPYVPPSVKGGIAYGRGTCDDKGPVVSMVAALKVLSSVCADLGLRLNRNVLGMFVVEEETGGNGSLSLAMDRDLKKLYDSILVCECTDLKTYPANRGAVWYKAELRNPGKGSLLEMASFVIEEMEKEGAAIRAESRHRLFPQRPVQTCHGIIGPFGEHPSRICGKVAFTIKFNRPVKPEAETLVTDCLEFGLASYIGLYGDKTKVTDPATGKPMVERHYSTSTSGSEINVEVFGATGHMGAIRERDGAITKMAHMVRSLVFSRAKIESNAGAMKLRLANRADGKTLVLEGGQGFVPTHYIDEVMARIRRAADLGAQNYLRRAGIAAPRKSLVTVTYEKLHNVAFDGDPDSPSMRNAIAAAKDCGIWKDEPVLGWTVSCDSRLFATEYPGMQVLTFGPGELVHAHSDQEQVRLEDLRKAAEFLALFIARQAGASRINP